MAATADLPAVMTADEVADLLRIDPDTCRTWLRAGYIDGTKVGRKWKISRSAVLDERGRVRPDVGPSYPNE